TGRARLQEPALSGAEGCHPEPIRKRASAPEGHGRSPRKPLEKDCHPERSSRFAKRSSYVVEGPLHLRHSQRSIKAFSLRSGQRSASRPNKARVETGLAPSQPAEQLWPRTRFWVAQHFSAAERPTLLHEREGQGFKSLP